MSEVLRIGVIGCGEIAQIIHLPTLRELPELFAVRALCDVSPVVLDSLGSQWPGAECFTDHRALLADASVDAVLIANHNVHHAATALDALAAGKHVLLEKPMCINLEEADSLAAAEARSGVIVQIGFMRRHAPAFTEAVTRIKALREQITLARVHDVIGMNGLIVDSTSRVVRRIDMPKDAAARTAAAMAVAVEAAIGVGSGARATAYGLLLGLGSHDISAMRELLGSPDGVMLATQHHGGLVVTATLDYGHYVCHYETALDRLPRFDAHLEVYTACEVLRVSYDTPYIRHLPATLDITRSHGTAGITRASSFPTRTDSFSIEWRTFHENIVKRLRPKTTVADAREDLSIFRDMLAVME
jgi:predicted dehydrogenase